LTELRITGITLEEPVGKGEILTTVVDVGTALLHQFDAVFQLLVVPNQPPVAETTEINIGAE
jgi:hypothetical protein